MKALLTTMVLLFLVLPTPALATLTVNERSAFVEMQAVLRDITTRAKTDVTQQASLISAAKTLAKAVKSTLYPPSRPGAPIWPTVDSARNQLVLLSGQSDLVARLDALDHSLTFPTPCGSVCPFVYSTFGDHAQGSRTTGGSLLYIYDSAKSSVIARPTIVSATLDLIFKMLDVALALAESPSPPTQASVESLEDNLINDKNVGSVSINMEIVQRDLAATVEAGTCTGAGNCFDLGFALDRLAKAWNNLDGVAYYLEF